MIVKLDSQFYNRHTAIVAQDLLGKTLVFNGIKGIITETESYRGELTSTGRKELDSVLL